MENTNTPDSPLETRLDKYLREKRDRDSRKQDNELLVRAEQVRILQGISMQCGVVKCPNCGEVILDPRPTAPDDDYDTRQ